MAAFDEQNKKNTGYPGLRLRGMQIMPITIYATSWLRMRLKRIREQRKRKRQVQNKYMPFREKKELMHNYAQNTSFTKNYRAIDLKFQYTSCPVPVGKL